MPIDTAKTSWGYAVTCTGGTAVATVVVPKGEKVAVQGIICTGAASTDIVTVTDGAGAFICRHVSPTTGGITHVSFNPPSRLDGIQVSVAGATTGWCSIFTE